MKKTSLIALAALLLCSACGSMNQKTATFITPTSQQVAAIKWDEAISASTTAKVSNTSLIFMR